jgi:hypothetical protein
MTLGFMFTTRQVRVIARAFAPEFRLLGWKGIGVAMPPAYFESWAQSFPGVFDWLVRADGSLGRFPLLRGMARHVLLQFERERSSSPPASSPVAGNQR